MKKKRYTYFSGLLMLCFCIVLVLGVAVPVQAHVEYINLTFEDLNQITLENYDESPYKGYISLSVTNSTSEVWGNFHFYLLDFGGYTSNVTFVDGSCSWAKAGASNCDPTKSPGSLDSWTISNGGKNMDLFYYSNPIGIGDTVTFEVYTDNTDNMQPFAVGFAPSVVPEPVSSALFIVGGATLGFRRFRKIRRNN